MTKGHRKNLAILSKLEIRNLKLGNASTSLCFSQFQVSSFKFQISNINLEHGDNFITVFGTNIYGQSTNDIINIYRETYDDLIPYIATNALIFPSENSKLYEGDLTNIIWNVELINDVMDNTNLTITRISVYIADTTNEIAIVTNDISNLLGEIPWYVPDYLNAGDTNYLMRFEVVDSSSLTNSRIFFDNPFAIIPEPFYLLFIIYQLLFINYWRRKLNPVN